MKYSSPVKEILYTIYLFQLFCLFKLFANPFTPQDVLNTKRIYEVALSPNNEWVAYTVQINRQIEDDPGSAYRELFLVSTRTKEIRPYITGKVNIKSIKWSPDGSQIGFITKRGENKCDQVWAIPADGGEARQLSQSESSVALYQWSSQKNLLAYVASTPQTEKEKELEKKGYEFIFFEENLKDRNLYLLDLTLNEKAQQLTSGVSVWDFQFNHCGSHIAAAISPENLVDHSYMFKKIHLIDIKSKQIHQLTKNEGKLGNFAFSPNDSKLVYAASLERKDHAVSQAFVINIDGGEAVNLTPENFIGHITWVSWWDDEKILYSASEGVWPTLSLVHSTGGERDIVLNSKNSGLTFTTLSQNNGIALLGSTPQDPYNVYYFENNKIEKLTSINSWTSERDLGEQQVIHYPARDGQDIEGLLLYPVDYKKGEKYPLIVFVHGGPESNYSNSWITRYSTPGQVLAGKGYAVFYPNYRASTGYGLKFALAGYKDAAGVEFDDIADGIDYLVDIGIADKERVGLGGGSYGGYAAAWFASYYTKYVKAVCMFVGISDLISKRGTTDIPYEELYVHSGEKLENMWEQSLQRSPIYWAHQSRTAVLILGGAADTRVHPSQSLEFYRRLKMNDHPAVRLVQYPGEQHGNSKQPGQIDVLYRQLQWYDWYVKNLNPLTGPKPPLDISELYGISFEKEGE